MREWLRQFFANSEIDTVPPADPDPVFHLPDNGGRRDPNNGRDRKQGSERRALLPTLKLTNVRAMKSRRIGEPFLGKAAARTQPSQDRTENGLGAVGRTVWHCPRCSRLCIL